MKIVLTGGGSGGHFYPLIAVAEEILTIAEERNLLTPELYYIADTPYDEKILFEKNIIFKRSPAGKVRVYFSIRNIFDSIKTIAGIIKSTFLLFRIYPDVVFSKGGYVSFPIIIAARILRIPIFIHDSDAVPGRVNLYSAKYARKIGISYPEAIDYFKEYKDKIAFVGNPIRRDILKPIREGGHEYLGLDPSIPTIFIIGGSQGSLAINDVILEALPELVERYQIVHQTGATLYEQTAGAARVILEGNELSSRYKPFDYLGELALRMVAGIASVVVSRAGSGTIYEIASWEIPAILVPIPEDISRDQRKNAYAYAKTGAAEVLEQGNLTPHVLLAELARLIESPAMQAKMKSSAKQFQKPDAARKIANELIDIALEHEA